MGVGKEREWECAGVEWTNDRKGALTVKCIMVTAATGGPASYLIAISGYSPLPIHPPSPLRPRLILDCPSAAVRPSRVRRALQRNGQVTTDGIAPPGAQLESDAFSYALSERTTREET